MSAGEAAPAPLPCLHSAGSLCTCPICSQQRVSSNYWAIDFLEHTKQKRGKGNLLLRFSGKFLKLIGLVSSTFHPPDGPGDGPCSLHVLPDLFPTLSWGGVSLPRPRDAPPGNGYVQGALEERKLWIRLQMDTSLRCFLMFQKN